MEFVTNPFQEAARGAAIESALSTPQYFVARYFADGHVIKGQEDFQATWWKTADLCQRLLLLAPRFHAKTTNMGVWYPLYRLCKWRWLKRSDPTMADPRIGLLSNTEGQAESLARAITIQLETNEKLIADFGNWKPEHPRKWTTLELIVDGWNAPNSKDVTLFAGGYGSAWLGRRIDLLIADDVADLKLNSSTDVARDQLLQWWREVITNCLETSGQVIVTGTMQHHQDLYNRIIHEEINRARTGMPRVWTVRKYKAIIQEETTSTPAEVLWPSERTYQDLLLRKSEIGTAAFEKQFQNNAVNEDLLCFRAEFLRGRCLDRTLVVGQVVDGWKLFIGVDPAVAASGLGKFFVMVCLAVDPDKRLHVVDVFRDRISVPRQLSWIHDWWLKYQPISVTIETNAYQKALEQVLRRDYPTMRIRPHFTHSNKVDPEVGVVSTCAPMVENGVLQLPYGDPMSVRKMDSFIDELSIWPEGEYTDQVMALWIAASAARDTAGLGRSRHGLWGTSVHNPMFPRKPAPLNGLSTLQTLDPQIEPTPTIDLSRGGRLLRRTS